MGEYKHAKRGFGSILSGDLHPIFATQTLNAMKAVRKFPIVVTVLTLSACGGGKSGEEIEKEAKESAEKAANESLNKLNTDTSKGKGGTADTSKARKDTGR